MCDAAERANSLRKITLIAEVVNAVREAIALEVESKAWVSQLYYYPKKGEQLALLPRFFVDLRYLAGQ